MTRHLLLLAALGMRLAAQDNCTDKSSFSSDLVTHAEVREETLAAARDIEINPDANGSIRVHGTSDSGIRVKACIHAAAASAAEAEALAKQVTLTDGPGRVVAKGPHSANHSWWSVSYEVWAPSEANLNMHTGNGSITAEGMHGHIQAHATNGSLKFHDVTSAVEGSTTNGSINVDVTNSGDLTLNATNGSIRLNLSPNVSATLEASTVNGSVRSDFAGSESGDERRHHMSHVNLTLGSGTGKITAKTVNGSIHIGKQS